MARLFKRPDSAVYYCYVPKLEGGTRKVTTNCTDERAARARAAELERNALDPAGAAATTKTLRESLELLIRERAARANAGKGSAATVGFYQVKSGVLLDGLAEVLKRSTKAAIFLREIDGGLVDDYIEQRRKDGVVESTIQKELTTWTLAMKLAKRRKWWRGDIDETFPSGFSPEYSPRKRFVTPEEFLKLHRAMVRPTEYRKHKLSLAQVAELRARFEGGENRKALAKAFGISTATLWSLSHAPDWGRTLGPERGHELFAIVCFSIATSAEWSAIWRAKRADIKDELARVAVHGSKNKNREREVPIQLFPFLLLLDFAARHGDGGDDGKGGQFLFAASHASSFRRRLAEACVRAGIPHLSPNDLRRTHSKWLRLSGVELANIFPSMGHADDRMLQRVYAQSSAIEVSHLQAAQIAAGPGMLMGGPSVQPGLKAPTESDDDPPNPSEKVCPGTESNRRHGDFQSPGTLRDSTAETTHLREGWEPNGKSPTCARTESGEPEEVSGDGAVPPSAAALERSSDSLEGIDPSADRLDRTGSDKTCNALDGIDPSGHIGPGVARAAPSPEAPAIPPKLASVQRGAAALAIEWDRLEEQAKAFDSDDDERGSR